MISWWRGHAPTAALYSPLSAAAIRRARPRCRRCASCSSPLTRCASARLLSVLKALPMAGVREALIAVCQEGAPNHRADNRRRVTLQFRRQKRDLRQRSGDRSGVAASIKKLPRSRAHRRIRRCALRTIQRVAVDQRRRHHNARSGSLDRLRHLEARSHRGKAVKSFCKGAASARKVIGLQLCSRQREIRARVVWIARNRIACLIRCHVGDKERRHRRRRLSLSWRWLLLPRLILPGRQRRRWIGGSGAKVTITAVGC